MNLQGTHEFELHVIKRILRGDTEAFSELIGRYEKSIVNYIYRYVMDYEESLDISQEVFVKAYYALDKYDQKFRFSTWLYRIARNAAIDNLRKKQLNMRSIDEPHMLNDDQVRFQIPSPEITPEDRLSNSEFVRNFNEAVQSLPLEYREVITLRHINHCSYQDIAAVCDIPIGTVKNRIFRGRELLRKKMEGKL